MAESGGGALVSLNAAARLLGLSRQGLTRAIKEGRVTRAVVRTPAGVKIASPILAARELLANSDPAKRPAELVDAATALPPPRPLDDAWQEHRGLWEAAVEWLIALTGGKLAADHLAVLERFEARSDDVAAACVAAGLLTPPEGADEEQARVRRNGHRRSPR